LFYLILRPDVFCCGLPAGFSIEHFDDDDDYDNDDVVSYTYGDIRRTKSYRYGSCR